MSIWTLEELDEQIATYKQALLYCSKSQSYTVGQRTLSRADLPEIRRTLRWLEREKEVLEGKAGPQMLRGRPKR